MRSLATIAAFALAVAWWVLMIHCAAVEVVRSIPKALLVHQSGELSEQLGYRLLEDSNIASAPRADGTLDAIRLNAPFPPPHKTQPPLKARVWPDAPEVPDE